jgi:hypothetical protein
MTSQALKNVDKLRKLVRLSDMGGDRSGGLDASAAIVLAIAALGPAGGGIRVDGAFWLPFGCTLPDNVCFVGDVLSPGQKISGNYAPSDYASVLILGGPIIHNSRNAIANLIIIQQNLTSHGAYPTPFANASTAAAAVAAFSGNAVQPPTGGYVTDILLSNVLILGFQYGYNGLGVTGLNRPLFHRVYVDCTNGIHVANVFDVGRAVGCEAWEFLTTNQAYTTVDLITRGGTAFYTGPGSTWFEWNSCFEYGWAVGHDANAVQDVRHIMCGADGPVGAAQPTIGFRYRGSMGNAVNVSPVATAQSDCCFQLNAATQNGVSTIEIVSPTCHGNNSASGYIHVLQGNYKILGGEFIDNSLTGAVVLEAAAGDGIISGASWMNLGAMQPVVGDVGAVSRCRVTNSIYQGSTNRQPLAAWTPVLKFGGAAVGMTYSTQLGSFEITGDRAISAPFKIILTAKGSSVGVATIEGLPKPVSGAGGAHGGGVVNYSINMAGLGGTTFTSGIEGTSTASIYQSGAAGVTAVTDANFTNTSVIYGTVTYNF